MINRGSKKRPRYSLKINIRKDRRFHTLLARKSKLSKSKENHHEAYKSFHSLVTVFSIRQPSLLRNEVNLIQLLFIKFYLGDFTNITKYFKVKLFKTLDANAGKSLNKMKRYNLLTSPFKLNKKRNLNAAKQKSKCRV